MNGTAVTSKTAYHDRTLAVGDPHTGQTMHRESTPLFKVDYSPNQSNQATELRSRRTQERRGELVTGPEKTMRSD